MQKKFWIYIISLFVSSVEFSFAIEQDSYLKKLESKNYLKLLDGREIIISQPGKSDEDRVKKRVFTRKGKSVIWDKTFNAEFGDNIWQGAHFIPIVLEKFIYDYDKDGNDEIAIAVWAGGQMVDKSDAYIFSIIGDALVLKKKEIVNYEFSRSVYKL
jgi:hypothetical protein